MLVPVTCSQPTKVISSRLSNERGALLLVQTSDAPPIANNPWGIWTVTITIATAVTPPLGRVSLGGGSGQHAADG